MTALVSELLASSCGKSSERYSLIELDIVSDNGSLTDNYACAVIDKEVLAYGSSRVDIDACGAVSIFRHDTWNDRNSEQVQLMCHAIYGYGLYAGIGIDDLVLARGCRISVKRSGQIGVEKISDLWNCFQKLKSQLLGLIDDSIS